MIAARRTAPLQKCPTPYSGPPTAQTPSPPVSPPHISSLRLPTETRTREQLEGDARTRRERATGAEAGMRQVCAHVCSALSWPINEAVVGGVTGAGSAPFSPAAAWPHVGA